MGERWPNNDKLSALNIRRACDASLARLQTDHIDLYQMHHVDRETPWEEIWQAMDVLVQQGKILYVGSSNFAGWHIAQANDTAAARGFFGLVSEQSIYNLLTREIELEVLPAAIEYGVGVIPWSPLEGGLLGGGLLGGVLKKEREGRRRQAGRAADTLQRHHDQIAAYEALCDELGEQPAHVALAWLLHQEGVTGPIIGPRTEDQLDDAQHAITVHLGEDVLKRLDDIFPGIRRACDASLRRLRTDYIDLYQMHHVDRDTPWDEIWQAMEVLVAQGKILYVGSSNVAGWHIAKADAVRPAGPPIPCSSTTSRSRPTRRCATSSASSRPTWRWPGCCTRRASPGRSSGRAPRTSWTTRSTRSPSTSARTCSSGSTTSSPGTSPPRSITPGKNHR